MVPGLQYDDQYIMSDLEFESLANEIANAHHKAVYQRMQQEELEVDESPLAVKMQSPRNPKRYMTYTEGDNKRSNSHAT